MTAQEVRAEKAPAKRSGSELESKQGKTSIANSVVQKIAAMATREIDGVHELGRGAARAMGAMRERIPGSGGATRTQGVAVEVGEKQTAVDLDIVVEYGVSIPDVAEGIRRNVISTIERMTGLEVVEVNVSVDDVHVPGEEAEEAEPSRVE